MGREFELKYRANESKIAAIAAKFGDFTSISMETTYYDTPERRLSPLHWTLRRRYENGKSVCTLKTPAPGGARGEWETECPDILSSIPELCKLGAPIQLVAYTLHGVEQVCGAKFTRLAKTLVLENCTVELALDRGFLMGGNREEPLTEVEVELKDGSEEAAIAFAAALAEEFGLIPEAGSKYRRALALAADM